ncbi:armadillo repeat-containing protein 2-like [Branchiostoma floridae]|uniref:Armadillo repeat-containing protein 2-like n=1 Tax=Branchiostoma floridae TaxID=7739 RepID=A0A9J7L9G6_BRAFL|nr:armadillo repeat-containing protein 2-like [Branchiostoma floridae]
MMSGRRRRKDDEKPFYAVPLTDKPTPSQIINEARQSVRTIRTNRPFTPREGERRLFGTDSGRPKEARPPSAFSLGSRHFDGSDSRPTSSTKLSPLDHKPKPVPDDVLPLVPKPPAIDLARPLAGRSVARRMVKAGSQDNLADRDLRQAVLTDGKVPKPPVERRGSLPPAPSPVEGDVPGRRVHSGPKERTPASFYIERTEAEGAEAPPRVRSAGSARSRRRAGDEEAGGDGRTGRESGYHSQPSSAERKETRSGSGGRRDDETPEEALFWNTSVLPILTDMESHSKDKKHRTLCDLCDRLYTTLDTAGLLGRAAKRRSALLKTLYKLIDIDDPRIMLKLARLILALKVSGKNLTNVCKLVFKISKEEKNDNLFLESNILGLLVSVVQTADPNQSCEALVYCCGALKFLSGNAALMKELSAMNCTEALGKLLSSVNSTNADSSRPNDQAGHLLVQVTAVLRNMADSSGNRDKFLTQGVVRELLSVIGCYYGDSDLMLNCSRIHSKLTLSTDCCVVMSQDKTCFKNYLRLLQKYQKKEDLVVRVLFILGNLSAKSEDARLALFHQHGCMETLLGVLRTFLDLDIKAASEDGKVVDGEGKTGPSKTEDVMIKLIRVIANMSIHPDVGAAIAENNKLVDLLLQILGNKSIARCEELVLNVVATINNLSYYPSKNSAIEQKQVQIAERMLSMLMADNMEGIVEASRVYGNLTRSAEVRDYLGRKKVDAIMVTLLDSGSREVVFTSCGVLINLMVDEKRRPTLKEEGGVKKLVDVLRDFGRTDWELASMVCQTLWNYSEKITSSIDCFGEEETNQLIELLLEFLEEDVVLGVPEASDWDREMREYMQSVWRGRFCPVATQLLDRVDSHHTDLEPLEPPSDS